MGEREYRMLDYVERCAERGDAIPFAPEGIRELAAEIRELRAPREKSEADEHHWVTFAAAALTQLDLGNGGEVDAKWCAKQATWLADAMMAELAERRRKR